MRRFPRFPLLAALVLAGCIPGSAPAQDYYAGQLTDDATGGTVCDQASASTCSLREAVDLVNANLGAGPHRILLGTGTHELTIAGVDSSNLAGDLDVARGVSIQPASTTGRVVIRAAAGTGDRVLDFSGGAASGLSDVTVTGGQAPTGLGGGIRVSGSGTSLRLDRVLITGNSASLGGGIDADAGSAVRVVQSTISGNSATGSGGGFVATATAALVEISGSTITANTADSEADGTGDGGGVSALAGSTVTVRESVIAGNVDASPSGTPRRDCAMAGTVTSAGDNVVGADPTCPSAGGVVTADPKLGPLADNGGRTDTHAPRAGSPVVDAGNPAGCAVISPVASLPVDARGIPRQGRCDAGAIEAQPDLVLESVSDNADPVTAGGDVVYTVTVRNSGAGPAVNSAAQLLIPAGVSVVGASAAGGCAGDTCQLGALAPGAAGQATFTVRTTAAGSISVAAVASGADPVFETTTANNTLNQATEITDAPAPAPTPAPTPTPPVVTPTPAAVVPSLGAPTVVSGANSLRVRVVCPRTASRAVCTGVLRLVAPPARRGGRTVVLARSRYGVARGRSRLVTLSPNAAARRLIRQRSPLRARLVAVPDGRGSRTASRAVTLRG